MFTRMRKKSVAGNFSRTLRTALSHLLFAIFLNDR